MYGLASDTVAQGRSGASLPRFSALSTCFFGTPMDTSLPRKFSTTAWDWAVTPTLHPRSSRAFTAWLPTWVLPVPGGPWTAT